MRELDSLSGSSSAGPYSRRSSRTERALDDPVREMEGMLVDEYGRFEFNSSVLFLSQILLKYLFFEIFDIVQQFKSSASWILYAPHA